MIKSFYKLQAKDTSYTIMRYLLHGDDISASRKFLSEITENLDVSTIEGKTINISSFELVLFSENLFGSEKAVVVENFFSTNKKKKELIDWLNSFKGNNLLVFWESKKLIKTSFSALKNTTIKEFSLPQVYFEFLDSFAPQRVQNLYQMYHLLLLSTEPTQIFYSLIKRLRALLIIQSGGRALEIEKMSSWQLSKLRHQARLWSNEKLIAFYNKLQDTEIKLKSGGLPIGLSKHLDLMILSDLI